MAEAEISGTSRSQHRRTANKDLLKQLEEDPKLASRLNNELGADVIEHMKSGKKELRNPPGTEWHHPKDSASKMELLEKQVHRDPQYQEALHGGGTGGYADFYGDSNES